MKNGLLGNPTTQKHIKIYGAGISGLALGFFLKHSQIPCSIYEARESAGGLIRSVHLKNGLSEAAANSFIPCAAIDEIIDATNIRLSPPAKASKKRYLVKNGKLTSFPLGFTDVLKMPYLLFKSQSWNGGSLKDFGYTFLGKEITHNLLEPAMAGIYGADIRYLDAKTVFPEFSRILSEKKRLLPSLLAFKKNNPPTSRFKGKGTFSFEHGMEELINGLKSYLNDDLIFNTSISELPLDEEVILTMPAYESAKLFEGHALQHLLNEVFYTPVISVTLMFKKSAFENFKNGFGCLIPRHEEFYSLGYIFSSCIFDNRVETDDIISLTAIIRDGDPDNPSYGRIENRDEEILDEILKDLDRLFTVKASPEEYKIWRWKKGIPIYNQKLREIWSEADSLLKTDFPNVRLYGNYTGNISIRGICTGARKIAKSL